MLGIFQNLLIWRDVSSHNCLQGLKRKIWERWNIFESVRQCFCFTPITEVHINCLHSVLCRVSVYTFNASRFHHVPSASCMHTGQLCTVHVLSPSQTAERRQKHHFSSTTSYIFRCIFFLWEVLKVGRVHASVLQRIRLFLLTSSLI